MQQPRRTNDVHRAARRSADVGWREWLSRRSVYVDEHILVPDLCVNHKGGTLTKPVDKLYVTVFPQVPSLSRVSYALQ